MAWLTQLRALLQRPRVNRELDDELAFHVEMETQANISRGMSPADARRAALRDFGGFVQAKESIRDVRRLSIESLWQDVRYAARTLGAHRGFTFAAVGMLALGIGITTAMFTVVDALILRPVPFRDAGQLARLGMGIDPRYVSTVDPAVLRAWRESPAFAGAEAANAATAVLESDGSMVNREIARVTPGIFDLLGGVRPVRGRLFERYEGGPGSDDRVLLSEDVWRTLYGGDPDIVGRRVLIDGEAMTVIGVLPSDFRFPTGNTVLWRPFDWDASPPEHAYDKPLAYVRFSRQMPREEALRLAADAARAADPRTARLKPQLRLLTDIPLDIYTRRALPVLVGSVVLVFFVLCANVCSLLLARLTSRRGEFTMRAALGASRGRLIRQAFVESALLGVMGVVAGAGIGWVLVSFAKAFLPDAFLLRTLNPLNVDLRALAATSMAGIVGTVSAGLLPAWLGTRVDSSESLRIVDRSGTEGRGARVLTRGLLVVEVALACTLLVGATLLVRSFVNLQRSDRGLDSRGVLITSVYLRGPGISDVKAHAAVMRSSVEDALRSLPGIRQIAWSLGAPPQGGMLMSGGWTPDVTGAAAVDMVVEQRYVGPEFFELYGIPLLRGRTFAPGDTWQDVIVGERLAAALWPGVDPIGRTFSHDTHKYHVIGLAREIHYPSVDPGSDRPELYGSYATMGASTATLSIRCMTECPSPALLRQRITAAHSAGGMQGVRSLDEIYLEQLARPRAAAAVAFAFAVIAVLAAAGGLFSVLSYAVGRRRREFGIRTALGASPAQIRRIVLRDGLLVAATGVAIGTVAAASLARVLESMQYGVTAADPLSWGIVLGLLAATTLAAAWRPARAAARMDPVVMLREE